jgi:protein O-mannosyl-transferase
VKSQRTRSAPQAAAAPVRTRWLRHPAAMAALCALTLLVYANSFGAGLTLDNKGLIVGDSRLRAAGSENVRQILNHTYWWPQGESGLYRPVTTLSYLFNYAVLENRDRPVGYHSVNFLLQCGNVLLVYALALRLWKEFWPSGMAVPGGLPLYLKSAESAGLRRWAWLAALMAVGAIGMFSKESAAVLPAVIVLF